MSSSSSSSSQSSSQQQRVSIYEIPVDSDGTAVMMLVQFLDMATKRGAFGLDETGKISECIQFLRRGSQQSAPKPKTEEQPAAAPAKPEL
tara:strand:+ start:835 stop:1104 length:270 start_codon:yes stop_codon:yes gene_type:complete